MIKEVEWESVVVERDDDIYYAVEGNWDDGTPLTEKELDELDYDKVYDIGFGNAIAAAEYAFEGDR